jgi:hypothetical protein
MVECYVDDIDHIVIKNRFEGWQATKGGTIIADDENEVKK